jgi:hypothetical protein
LTAQQQRDHPRTAALASAPGTGRHVPKKTQKRRGAGAILNDILSFLNQFKQII